MLRRCRRDGGRRRGIAGHAGCRWPASPPAGRCRPISTTRPKRPRVPTTATATASSWARAPASSCSKSCEHAKARGAKIYAEVIGYGLSGDAYHITAPAEDGDGAYRCMTMALKRAGLTPADIDYINAHGTSTMADTIELGAVERLVGNAASKISMSSTKSAIGHLLGAAGAVEAIFSILAIRDNIAPPTINLDNPERETAIDLVPHKARPAPDRRRAVQFLRLRRHQRLAGLPALRWLSARASRRAIWPYSRLRLPAAICAIFAARVGCGMRESRRCDDDMTPRRRATANSASAAAPPRPIVPKTAERGAAPGSRHAAAASARAQVAQPARRLPEFPDDRWSCSSCVAAGVALLFRQAASSTAPARSATDHHVHGQAEHRRRTRSPTSSKRRGLISDARIFRIGVSAYGNDGAAQGRRIRDQGRRLDARHHGAAEERQVDPVFADHSRRA